jgi:zinc protease
VTARGVSTIGLVLVACAGPRSPGRPAPEAVSAPRPGPASSAASADAGTPWSRSAPPAALARLTAVEAPRRSSLLPNGLGLLVVEEHRRPIVSIRLVFPTGAAADPDDKAGATFLAFALLAERFDEKKATGEPVDWDEKSARREVAEAGGQYGFNVMQDAAWIGIDGYARDAALYMRFLEKIIRARRHGDDSFFALREGTRDWLEDLETADENVFMEAVARLAFGAAHPYSRPVNGTERSLAGLGLEDVVERQQQALCPGRATLVVVGDVTAAEVARKAEAAFLRWPPCREVSGPQIPLPPVGRRAVVVLPRRPATTTLVCASRALSDVKGADAALDVVALIVGHRRLHDAIREEKGWTYTPSAGVSRYRRARAFVACSHLPANQTEPGLKLFTQTLAALSTSPPSEEEVETAKAMLVSQRQIAEDDVLGTVAQITSSLALEQPVAMTSQLAALRGVTVDETRRLAKRLFAPGNWQLALSGETGRLQAAVAADGLGPASVLSVAHPQP